MLMTIVKVYSKVIEKEYRTNQSKDYIENMISNVANGYEDSIYFTTVDKVFVSLSPRNIDCIEVRDDDEKK